MGMSSLAAAETPWPMESATAPPVEPALDLELGLDLDLALDLALDLDLDLDLDLEWGDLSPASDESGSLPDAAASSGAAAAALGPTPRMDRFFSLRWTSSCSNFARTASRRMMWESRRL